MTIYFDSVLLFLYGFKLSRVSIFVYFLQINFLFTYVVPAVRKKKPAISTDP